MTIPAATTEGDRLASLRGDLEQAAQRPVGERLQAFEAINAALASELAELDEL